MPVAAEQKHRKRLLALAIFFGVMLAAIIIRLSYVQLWQHNKYVAQAARQQYRQFEIPAARGQIYLEESDGLYPIALNQQQFVVAGDPKFIKDQSAAAEQLSKVLQEPVDKLQQKLKAGASGRYVEFKKGVNYDTAQSIKDLKLAGLFVVPRAGRYYPESNLFSHVLGYVNSDGEGQYGIEQYHEAQLHGKDGLLKAVTDSLGVPITSTENIAQSSQDGQSYVLTLDRKIQSLAHDALSAAVQNNKAESGSIIVMDPKTGAIKALVNYPDFDPNNYGQVAGDQYRNFTNSAVSSLFEPGSGFKVITMAAGIDAGKVKPDTKYDDKGELEISGYTVKNAENHKFGIQTMTDVIQKSLNTGVIFVLQNLGSDPKKITLQSKEVLYNYFQKFGFGQKTGVAQAGEANAPIKQPKVADIDYANMSFGQGISVTSMQMISAVATIANGGTRYEPQLISKTISPDGKIVEVKPKVAADDVINSQAAATVADMMISVVEKGSGYQTKTKGYRIAGKTGTAQVPRADGKGYEEKKNIGSFVGFAPVEDPKFIILVRIDYPRVEGFAESTAVPAFATVARELFAYYKIPPKTD